MNALVKVLVLCCFSMGAWANEVPLEKISVATDATTIERGAEDLMNTCHSCHTLKYIRYRDLVTFGIDKQKVDAWRGDQPMDSPLFGQLSDADAMQAFGIVPPDLSLMVKARDGGPSYVYSYLLAYHNSPDGVLENPVYPATKMPDALGIASATDAAQRTEIQGRARDIVSFLTWAADPHDAERKRLGYYVLRLPDRADHLALFRQEADLGQIEVRLSWIRLYLRQLLNVIYFQRGKTKCHKEIGSHEYDQ